MDLKRLQTDTLALALLAATVFLALALVSYDPRRSPGDVIFPARSTSANLCGSMGAQIAHGLRSSVGVGAWLILVALGTTDALLFARKLSDPGLRLMGAGCILGSLCSTAQAVAPGLGHGPAI